MSEDICFSHAVYMHELFLKMLTDFVEGLGRAGCGWGGERGVKGWTKDGRWAAGVL